MWIALLFSALALQTTPEIIARGELVGRMSVTARLCQAAGHAVDEERAEAALVEFEALALRAGLSRGEAAEAYDVGMDKEIALLSAPPGPNGEALADPVTRTDARVTARCRYMEDRFPGLFVAGDEGQRGRRPGPPTQPRH